jgi:GntR family transcriptional regulator, rspAB operon transcriptional repressor
MTRHGERSRVARAADGLKTSWLFDELKRQIFFGERLPGDPITELQLMKEYEASQSTIRQALFKLESHGLVTRSAYRATFVTNLSQTSIRERIETRVALEALAWKRAIPNLGSADIAELRRLSRRLARRGEFEIDYDFHSLLWQRARNETLFRTLDQLVTPMFAAVNLARGSLQSRSARAHSHEEIVDILERGDVKHIDEAVERHISGAYRHFGPRYRDCRELAERLLIQTPKSRR